MKTTHRWNKLFVRLLGGYIIIALLAPFLANEKPLFVSIGGKKFFPAFSNDAYFSLPNEDGSEIKSLAVSIDWKNLKTDQIIFPPVAWSPERSDITNVLSSPGGEQFYLKDNRLTPLPFRWRHFLGTGKLGNDTLATLIHGTRSSMLIGVISMAIAFIPGIIFGAMAGFFGDHRLRCSRIKIIFSVLLIVPAWFYAFYLRRHLIAASMHDSILSGTLQIIVGVSLFFAIVSLPFFFPSKSTKKKFIPVDSLISKFTGIFIAMPRLVLIITIAAITRPSLASVVLIIGFTSWTEISRIVRAQVLQLREMNFIEAAGSIGLPATRIFIRHLLPNLRDQLVVIALFGIGGAILTETGLSFLGIGLPPGTPTWGSIMYEARQHYTAWWLVIFSGLAIFGLLYSLFGIASRKHQFNS
jgi:peptide/nickel transport system permease protein